MGRRSLAEELYEEAEDGEEKKGRWIVVYDFEVKPNPRFWTNLHRLSAYSPGSRLLQHSVYLSDSERVARATVMLARHYEASVEVFKGEFVDPSAGS